MVIFTPETKPMFTRNVLTAVFSLLSAVCMTVAPGWAATVPLGQTVYVDNSTCLLNPHDSCNVADFNVSAQVDIPESVIKNTFNLSNGTLRIYWPEGDDFTELMNKLSNGWSTLPGGGYKVQFGNRKVWANVLLLHASSGKKQNATCSGELWLGPDKFLNGIGKNNGISCKIPSNFFPQQVFLTTSGSTTGKLAMTNTPTDERNIIIPSTGIEFHIDGFLDCALDYCQRPSERILPFNLIQETRIQLNDRVCKISVNNPDINFGSIESSAKGVIAEREMPISIQCSGYSSNLGQISGLGVRNQILGVRIRSASDYFPSDNKKETIGLKTNGQIRKDLYVDGSYSKGLGCGINALKTDQTTNKFDSPIDVGQKDPQDVPANQQPKIYWRLCSGTNGSLEPGKFEGQAYIDVEYK